MCVVFIDNILYLVYSYLTICIDIDCSYITNVRFTAGELHAELCIKHFLSFLCGINREKWAEKWS